MSSRLSLPRALLAVLALLAAISSARAEEGVDTFGPFRTVPDQPGVLILDGFLPIGSASVFQWAIETLGVPDKLLLNSKGGAVEEGLLVADMVRTFRIETEIPAGAVCYSSCMMPFFAGVGRQANGVLGLHDFVELRPGKTYLLDPPSKAVAEAAMLRFGATPQVLMLTFKTPNENLRFLTPAVSAAMGLNRTREQGLLLADAEDIAPTVRLAGEALQGLEPFGEPGGGATLTTRQTGMPDQTTNGFVQWMIGRDQGTVAARVVLVDAGLEYTFILAPFTGIADYLDGVLVAVKTGNGAPVPLEQIYEFYIGTPLDPPLDGETVLMSAVAVIGQMGDPSTMVLGLPRLMSAVNRGRFEAANSIRFVTSVDGTLEGTLTLDFDVNQDGRAAFAEAFQVWDDLAAASLLPVPVP